jgi:RNA polymerase sigma-70 factor (ECF subfamily)
LPLSGDRALHLSTRPTPRLPTESIEAVTRAAARGQSGATPAMIGPEFSNVLLAAQDGDEGAFAELWRSLQPQLLRYLRVVVGDANEDVASETWSRVARDITQFEGTESGFRSWVFTIARHRGIDWRRREARRPAAPHPNEDFADVAGTDDPADSTLEALSTDAALALIARLPPGQAEVVTLRTVAGLSVEQVAEIVGKRPGAVRVLAHRGLQRLAELLADTEQRSPKVTP